MKRRLGVASILLLFLVSGCRVGPEYQPPCPPSVSDEWKTQQNDSIDTPLVCNWWEVFQDDTLNRLEAQATANNPNLYIAFQHLEEAWAQAGISRADLFPQFNLRPAYSDTGELFKIYLPAGTVIPGTALLSSPYRIHQYQDLFPINMNYELDLWGKYRGQYESAVFSAEAEEQAYRTALLSLTASVASSYFSLRTFDAAVAFLKDIVELRRQDYELNQSRYNKGLANALDVANALVELSNAESQYDDNMRQRVLQENQIATLIGVPASDFHLELMPLEGDPPQVPAGIPSDIIQQRPDIAEAERNMAAEHVLIGVAYANFLPSFELTGALGYSSPSFHDFMKWKRDYG